MSQTLASDFYFHWEQFDLSNQRLVVAYSGGVDSTVLLYVSKQFCTQHDISLACIHVNHNISPNADKWQQHCQQVCADLEIDLCCVSVDISPYRKHGIEAAARHARYHAFSTYCKADDILLLGQHMDDQAETLLLRLTRGAGPKGLSAMASKRYLRLADAESQETQEVVLVRPLLNNTRQQILAYANENQLTWIEDESNQTLTYDRNFLRADILPKLSIRWPKITRQIAKTAQHCASQQRVVDEYMGLLETQLIDTQHQIKLTALLEHSIETQACFVRHWLAKANLDMPSEAVLRQILNITTVRADAQPSVMLGRYCVYRFNDLLAIRMVNEADLESEKTADFCLSFNASAEQSASNAICAVSSCPSDEAMLFVQHRQVIKLIRSPDYTTKKLKPIENRPSKPLKQWFKEWRIPPYKRTQCIKVIMDDVLVAVYTDRWHIDIRYKQQDSTRHTPIKLEYC